MKTLKHYIYLLLTTLLFCSAAMAQTPPVHTRLHGSVVNNQQQPVEFATVSLLRAKDSSVVKGALGDVNGKYNLERIIAGTYIIKTTAVGFQKGLSKAFTVSDNTTTLNIPAITMQGGSKTLKTVEVSAAKPLLERKLDRMVMNVENSVLAAGNNAMEILERAPGVTIDKDDNISLQGKQGVTVMINGKLTYLSSAQLATLLRSTDGSNIATIEIITNPSAKYDAAGNSGIINIVMKKNKTIGTSGSIVTSVNYGKNWRGNESFTLNHKQGALNLFGNFSHGDGKSERELFIQRRVDSADKSTYFNQYNNMGEVDHNNNYRVGADYDLTKNHTIGFAVNGYFNNQDMNTPSTTYIGTTPTGVDSYLKSSSMMAQSFKSFSANLNDRLKLDTAGQELGIDLDYSRYNNNQVGDYMTNTFKPSGQELAPQTSFRNVTPSVITIKAAKADYTLPLTKELKFETGAKFSDVQTDNTLLAQLPDGNGGFVNDNGPTSNSNHFIYTEKINAGYINLGQTWKNTSAQIGVRAEQTISKGDLVGKDGHAVDRNYVNLFPSLFINQKLDKKNQVGFSYSRRIDRPNYSSLNPFLFYLDKYTYSKGNPFLNPQYTDSYELHYTWNNTINVNLNYSRTKDVITEIILTDTITKASYQTNMNLQVQNAYSINISSPFTIVKWWTGNVNLNTFYLGFKSGDLLGARLNNGRVVFQGKLTQTFSIVNNWKLELFSNYQSPLTYGIYDIRPRYSTDAGVSRTFANKRANIKFSVSDIFNTRTNNINSMYQSVNLAIRQKGETRISRISFTYNFGNTKIKARDHQTGAEQEKGRVGGN